MTINLDIHKVADDIDFPVKEWPGKCYQVASALVEAGVVDGEAVYGHWTGPINPTSPVFGDRADLGFTHHGWIVMEDGTVVDPTRWVFENAKPYIFIGKPPEDDGFCRHCEHSEDEHANGFFNPCTECDCHDFERKVKRWPYDEGGNQLRATLAKPPPRFNSKKEKVKLKLPASAGAHCLLLLQDKGWTLEQVFWLANLPYDRFGPFVFDVYKAIAACGKEMLIPIDNRHRAERELAQEKRRGRTKKVSKVRG
jgi:hypothetical protein